MILQPKPSNYTAPELNLDGTPYKLPLEVRRKNISSLQAALPKAGGNIELITLLCEQLKTQRAWMVEDWGVNE